MMRRSSSRPQQLREQLLQAIDEQNNIHNEAAVLDVIYCLERYPMTKEALMETRLGKLINDVRKKCTDEDVVERLKRLVRSWQRLIGVNGVMEKELSCPADTAHSIRGKLVSRSTQTFGNFVYSNANQRAERCYGSASGKSTNHFRRSKIPIRAINPYSSSLISTKQPYASMNVRTSLSNQPPQDHQNVGYLQKSKSALASQKNLVTGEPALSTSAVSHVPSHSSVQDSHTEAEQLSDFMNNHILKNLFSPTEVSNGVKEPTVRTFENETIKNQHCTSNDKHNGHHIEGNNKPAQLNGSNIAYDHHTKQVKLISYKTSNPLEDCQRTAESAARASEDVLVQETNSSELSQRKMIKPDTIFQNSLTTESQTLGMNLNVAENLKQGDHAIKECRQANVFVPDFCMTELPRIHRDLTENDLYRLHHDQWHGVNGCYDNRKNWYDWTQSFTLDSHGSPLKISPYVCIDYRL
ncbi:mediator of RNA polymerase II transcription subunit 26-like isoform X2 [Triplophysa rosa]|uniref:Mediator of RNA polymerase II transcription subunit 26 n=2 Tax=Triplophysa rosa TaxID=992332 RepID=A0A9W7TF94_TRIRA|nr:mediator of RNA polymerase II transcription subunit 26-like isoform X2 [Triplophysa rosa]KAI7795383.1 putative mediator of RNA polymerase II transcription subunit 26-like [Triplophysa rosa]